MVQRAFRGTASKANICFYMGFSHPLEHPGYAVRGSAVLHLSHLFLHRFFRQSILDTMSFIYAVRHRWTERLLYSPGEGRYHDQAEGARSTRYRFEASRRLNSLCVDTGNTLLLPL